MTLSHAEVRNGTGFAPGTRFLPILPGETGVVVVVQKPGDEGSCYTLRLPDGREAQIGDALDAYSQLADIIDEAFEEWTP